jgi:hypothetical protein
MATPVNAHDVAAALRNPERGVPMPADAGTLFLEGSKNWRDAGHYQYNGARTATEKGPDQSYWSGPVICDDASRGGGIRTHDLFVPNEARYQAAPHPA